MDEKSEGILRIFWDWTFEEMREKGFTREQIQEVGEVVRAKVAEIECRPNRPQDAPVRAPGQSLQ